MSLAAPFLLHGISWQENKGIGKSRLHKKPGMTQIVCCETVWPLLCWQCLPMIQFSELSQLKAMAADLCWSFHLQEGFRKL